MDSESSSGNDEEFDSSKNETDNNIVSSLLNHSPHYPFLTQQNPTFFDPQNTHNHLDQPLIPQSNPNYGDLIWSRGLSSNQPNYANFENLTPQQAPYSSPSSTTHPTRPSVPSDQLSNVIKNPKKRTRASRRAPTTVLTTDPTNFRQMVQEFTGIPASPFSGSPFSRRPDIFSGLRPNPHLDTLGPLYPLRPANKIFTSFSSPSPPPLLNSSSIGPTTSVGATTSSNSNNYRVPFEHLLNLQLHQNIDPLQMSGFPSQEDGNNDENAREIRWRSGEIVRNNDGVRENNMVTIFDGNSDMHVSGSSSYNLNLISEKDHMENVVASSGHQGNVASWICPSD